MQGLPQKAKGRFRRTQASWNTDPAGVLLVATGYPSDGAVYYVYGVELRRTTMPAGPITHTTPAVGTGPMEERFSIPTNALRQGDFRSFILIDGSFEDWEAIPVVMSDPAEGGAGALDIADVQAANDEDWLYLRLTLHAPGVFNTSTNNIFFDANPDNPGFGVLGIGSEMLIHLP